MPKKQFTIKLEQLMEKRNRDEFDNFFQRIITIAIAIDPLVYKKHRGTDKDAFTINTL